MLTEFQRETLNLMISDLSESTNTEYNPSPLLWYNISNSFQQHFDTVGIHNIQNQISYNGLFSGIWESVGDLKSQSNFWLYYNLLKSKDKFNLLEKTNALTSDGFILEFIQNEIEGRPEDKENKILNWDYLISMDTIITIANMYPNILIDSLSICEVGAGWGRIAYYLMQINNKISYNIFDIPHTLLICSEYLRQNIDYTKVFTYQETKNNKLYNKADLLNSPGINFSIPNSLENFENKSFDLFINIASFQEMPFDQVSKYFERINSLSSRFYTQQRYKDLDMNYSKYPYYSNWNLLLDGDVNFHPLWFERFYEI